MFGILTYWNQKRGFGFIEAKSENGRINRYFLHCSKIDLCALDEPVAGCVVTFNVSTETPKGNCPIAVNVEIAVRRDFSSTLMQAPTEGAK
jgi:cold shock CspA family protein